MTKKLFDEQVSRKPDLYPWTSQFIDAMHEGHWSDKEFTFKSDVQDFKVKLNDQEREMVTRALSAIGQIEVAVKTFWVKLGDNLPHPSIQDMGIVMGNIEVIHNNAYERLLGELDLNHIFEENLKLDFIQGRVKYLKKYTHKFHSDNKKQFIYSLILFTLFVENVSLFSQFYVILWFGRKNLLKEVNQQVMYTLKEEDIHSKAGMKLINELRKEYPDLFDKELEDRIIQESLEAFKAEEKIVEWMVNGRKGEKLNSPLLKEFIKNRINESLEGIGYNKAFDVDEAILENTEWFNDVAYGDNLTDFFDSRPVEYAKANQSFSTDSLF
jgi:ribonucleoside-diphosphate reductase beta chain